jgi:hypothetical protein
MTVAIVKIAAAQSAIELHEAMTPESLHERAVTASDGLSTSIVAEAFSSGRIELVKAAFLEPNLSFAFTTYLQNMRDSTFNDRVLLMLLNEAWNWDNIYDSEDSRPRMMLPLACFEVIGKRFKSVDPNLEDAALYQQLSSLESRKKLAAQFAPFVEEQEKTNTEDPKRAHKGAPETSSSPSAPPPRATKRAPDMTLATQANEKPISSTPWSIIVGSIVAALGVLWFLLKGRK